MAKETYLPVLLQLLRQHGYDGATLSKISQATGLGKASLYHYFPGGKDEMVTEVLTFLGQWLGENVLSILRSNSDLSEQVRQMCDRLSELYEGGHQPCLFAILLLGSARDVFQVKVKELFCIWIDEMARVFREAGLSEVVAKQKAEDVAIAIQGALILSQALENPSIFQRVMRELSEQIK